ncbi:MAG TPA: crosslink repair DNA glycosylase YcaQ family protein [Tepidisphaeraceae bacterium]|jgi:hypothetical protein
MSLTQLRAHAIGATFFPPTTLAKAIDRLGFVQADPIRSPARAQDLILRHRVRNYSAGDLERKFETLDVEEDYLYAYGFMSRSVWEDLHPRAAKKVTKAERRVLDIVTEHQKIHPRELEAYLGRERQLNAWGGYSKATTRILHSLQHRGLLRVAGRENGIRLYAPRGPLHAPADPDQRIRRLALLIASILAPISISSLRSALQLFGRASPSLPGRLSIVTSLLTNGDLQSSVVDDIHYVWPTGQVIRRQSSDVVRFLAPFDPLVWDRRRFEHLWGWPYRFEAYTPPAKRKLGYYAMPLLWRDAIIGWVNISNVAGNFRVEPGYIKAVPDDTKFQSALDAEVHRFQQFLQVP